MRRTSLVTAIAWTIGALIALPPSVQAQARPIRLVVLGDSLSSGFLIPRSQALPATLEAALRQRGYDVTIGNAAISGNTSQDGLARVDRDVQPGTDGVMLELGANDMLRRQPAANLQANLDQIVLRLRARGIPVLLTGTRLAPDSGADLRGYEAAYRAVARRHGLSFYPDIYAGVASNRSYTIFDNTHPSPAGVQVMTTGLLPTATTFVARIGAKPQVVQGR